MIDPFPTLLRGHYGAIVIDPPWRFETWSETRQTRAAFNHYSLMTFDDIKRLPISDLAKPDCVLFLWVLNSMLPQGLEVLRAWGFSFKTVGFTWAKQTPSEEGWHFGLGYWTRQNTEQVLLATIGSPERLGRDVPQLIVEPRREHSRKPECVHERVERLVAGPYLELFARSRRPGWTSWGDEADKYPVAAK